MKSFIVLLSIVFCVNSAAIPDVQANGGFDFRQVSRYVSDPGTRDALFSLAKKIINSQEAKDLLSYMRNNNVDFGDLRQAALTLLTTSQLPFDPSLNQAFSGFSPADLRQLPFDPSLNQAFSGFSPADLRQRAASPVNSKAVATLSDPQFQALLLNIANLDFVQDAVSSFQSSNNVG